MRKLGLFPVTMLLIIVPGWPFPGGALQCGGCKWELLNTLAGGSYWSDGEFDSDLTGKLRPGAVFAAFGQQRGALWVCSDKAAPGPFFGR